MLVQRKDFDAEVRVCIVHSRDLDTIGPLTSKGRVRLDAVDDSSESEGR